MKVQSGEDRGWGERGRRQDSSGSGKERQERDREKPGRDLDAVWGGKGGRGPGAGRGLKIELYIFIFISHIPHINLLGGRGREGRQGGGRAEGRIWPQRASLSCRQLRAPWPPLPQIRPPRDPSRAMQRVCKCGFHGGGWDSGRGTGGRTPRPQDPRAHRVNSLQAVWG